MPTLYVSEHQDVAGGPGRMVLFPLVAEPAEAEQTVEIGVASAASLAGEAIARAKATGALSAQDAFVAGVVMTTDAAEGQLPRNLHFLVTMGRFKTM